VDLSVPEAMGGGGGPGTNPEELFAVGYAACFQSALFSVAYGRKLDASGSQIVSGSARGWSVLGESPDSEAERASTISTRARAVAGGRI
jgi:organic hydroperoxide reductase OsmC/OhrA